ncbi:MAG: nucleotidyltransferase family protein [Clostridiales bacterium]|nr:nucleotidyltransferase family protein [Clostridiales bacterium]
MLTAIILASGYSKRFNKNKLTTLINGKPLVEITLQVVCHANFGEVIVVYREEEVKRICEKFNVQLVENTHAEKGMSESVKLGVESASEKTRGYMFFVGDQPFLNNDVINELMNVFLEHSDEIIIPTYKGIKSNPVTFPVKYKKELLQLHGDAGGRQIIKKLDSGKLFYEINDEKFCIDLDTYDDYLKVSKMFEKGK